MGYERESKDTVGALEILEMTNEEYREQLLKLIDGVEDNKLLHDFHAYATQRISGRAVDYHVTDPNYGDMIIEMVEKKKELIGVINSIESLSLLEHITMYSKRLKEKW